MFGRKQPLRVEVFIGPGLHRDTKTIQQCCRGQKMWGNKNNRAWQKWHYTANFDPAKMPQQMQHYQHGFASSALAYSRASHYAPL